ncbi:hypothetical protein LTR78_000107 [Recurvomyces mirabilis]|uniref:Phosphoribulokinase/uridine kinase domain-containing protein n=1 Tax=Recurvomyces mirabilis TaxID=574656 RepID=A0AAE1C6A3_9PEZI|nr:hypothetical protein LTR78_000107 [Recurvomyces mirabilis]KAK5161764.1 hypothetical protein LTS14_000109 [Recurvomyces mirabilis]
MQDGFHHSKAELGCFQDPDEAYRRRGAPYTFNAEAFLVAVLALKSAKVTTVHESGHDIAWPGFDHAKQDPIPDAILVPSTTRVIVLEGNYVLLNDPPWSKISAVASERWFVDVPREIAKERLVLRHLAAGIEESVDAATARIEYNDLRNGDYIFDHSIPADVVIANY